MENHPEAKPLQMYCAAEERQTESETGEKYTLSYGRA